MSSSSSNRKVHIYSILATICIGGGISSLIVGLASVVAHGAIGGDTSFGHVGTVLLIVAIPMLLGGSIFLDEADRRH